MSQETYSRRRPTLKLPSILQPLVYSQLSDVFSNQMSTYILMVFSVQLINLPVLRRP